MSKKLSKGKIIDQLCGLLNLNTEDYTRLGEVIQALIGVASTPHCGVLIVWRPQIPASLNFNTVNLPRTPQALQDAAQAVGGIAQQLSSMAVRMAVQQGASQKEGGKSAESAQS